jgi:hypothetical protein
MTLWQRPPEVLQWARTTLQGITALENKARWHGLEVDSEMIAMFGRIERELIAFLETHKTTDPAKWVSSD